MKNNLGNIKLDGKSIDLNISSRKGLKDILNQINDEEIMIKQELDNILKRLV